MILCTALGTIYSTAASDASETRINVDDFGRGGGDRTRPHNSKSRDLMALQPPSKSNC